jgi:hypothetical protein
MSLSCGIGVSDAVGPTDLHCFAARGKVPFSEGKFSLIFGSRSRMASAVGFGNLLYSLRLHAYYPLSTSRQQSI